MKVLLLEDDDRVARGILRLVTTLGHEPLHARRLDEAKSALAAGDVALVLADEGLGEGESGIDLLEWARRNHPGIRRVLTSGASPPPGFQVVPREQTFLLKPFGKTELAQLIASVPAA